MAEFTQDPGHWLFRLSPDQWIRAALGELSRAEKAWDRGDARSGVAGVKRAAGMALNGALIVEPNPGRGRTYIEHLESLVKDPHVPAAVREACALVLGARGPGGDVVVLRTPRSKEPVLEAARDVIAHAWAVVKRHEPAR